MASTWLYVLLAQILGIILPYKLINGGSPTYEELYNFAQNNFQEIYEEWGYLHQHPELFFREFETSNFIKNSLKEHNIAYEGGYGQDPDFPEMEPTGVIADIGNGQSPCIGLRADIDALPVQEMVDFEFKSIYDGKMHACGHDANTAMLLGAARILNHYKDQIDGTVRLMWQPGEEGGGGGKAMINDGVFTKEPKVVNSFAMHVWSTAPTGQLVTNKGSILAAATDFKVTFTGSGGHAARHHMNIDPIPAGVAFVRGLYDMYARERYFQTDHAGLVSVCLFESSSTATNVMPDTVTVGGTLRAMKTDTLMEMDKRMKEIGEHIAAAYRCKVSFSKTMRVTYPNTENDPELYDLVVEKMHDISTDGIGTLTPMMGGEDYSFMTQAAPGLLIMIGSGSGDEVPGSPPTNYAHHTAKFHVDKKVLSMGAATYAYLAFQDLEWLNNNATQ